MASSVTNKKRAYEALRSLGGLATTRQVATLVGRSVNGVSQTLGSIVGLRGGGGEGGDSVWIIPEGHQYQK